VNVGDADVPFQGTLGWSDPEIVSDAAFAGATRANTNKTAAKYLFIFSAPEKLFDEGSASPFLIARHARGAVAFVSISSGQF